MCQSLEKKLYKPNRAIIIRNSMLESTNIKPYLSIKEACLLLGVGDGTIRKLIKQGSIKTFYTGGKHLIRRQDLENLFTQSFKE